MRLKVLAIVVLLSAVVAFWFFRSKGGTPGKTKTAPRNVILITIDTLRADHLGCYGDTRARTPAIDAIAARGQLFRNATATNPLTLPSHSSIMTGANPTAHGVRDNGGFYLDSKWVTLAETLKTKGYRTGGFISAFVLDRRWGIAQGFDKYFDNFELSKYKAVSLDAVQRRGDETLAAATRWLNSLESPAAPFFAWIHLYDPHSPYDPPHDFRPAIGNPEDLYRGEISYTDTLVAHLQDYLHSNDLHNTTSIVITSDHGESLGEHEESGHGFFIYDATTRVPLIFHIPGFNPAVIQDQVRSIDIYPTLCDLLGINPPGAVEGVSLLPLLKGKPLAKKLLAYSESYYPKFHYGWSELKALRSPEYKFISAPRPEFYRVNSDPGEKEDLYSSQQKRAEDFDAAMQRILQGASPAAAPVAVDDESLEKLHALGYIGSFVPSAESPQNAADPKDKIRLYNAIKTAQWLSAEEKIAEAEERLQRIISEDPKMLEAHLILGNIGLKKEDYSAAQQSFQNALQLNPEFTAAIFGLARAYELQKQWEPAMAGFQRLAALDPRDSKPYFHLGDIALTLKRFPEALKYYNKLVEIDPAQAGHRNRLGACYLEMKDFTAAYEQFQKALSLNPRMPNSHFNLGLIMEERGNLAGAMEAYESELSLFPESYPARFNLSQIYRRQNRRSEERKELEECVAKSPGFGPAYLYLAKNLMDAGDDLNRAKSFAEQGLMKTVDTRNLTFGHYLLADIYTRLKQPQAASAHLQKARQFEKSLHQ